MATVEQFAQITRAVIAESGFEEFLPTVLYPNRQKLGALEGAPDGPKLETVVLRWATEGAIDNEEFLVAFKVAPTKFKVIRCHSSSHEERVFDAFSDDA